VSGHAFVETEFGKKAEGGGQAFFAVPAVLSSAKKTFRALFEVLDSRRNPFKSAFVVQTFQNGFPLELDDRSESPVRRVVSTCCLPPLLVSLVRGWSVGGPGCNESSAAAGAGNRVSASVTGSHTGVVT
jgi:hypothetical protein